MMKIRESIVRNLWLVAVALLMSMALSGCDDLRISNSLEGTWEGNTYMAASYRGRWYNSTYSYVFFEQDPYRYTSGRGRWIDYYSNAPWDYIANHITWRVDNGVIRIYFIEDNYSITLTNYRLSNRHFYGTFLFDGNQRFNFDLVHTSSPNWNSYNYGYDYWQDGYYYAPARSTHATATSQERPRRGMSAQHGNTP